MATLRFPEEFTARDTTIDRSFATSFTLAVCAGYSHAQIPCDLGLLSQPICQCALFIPLS